MSGDSSYSMLQERVDYLEGKCAVLTRSLEGHLLSCQEQPLKSTSVNALEEEVRRLRAEKERLERKVSFLYSSVSWRLTRPIRLISVSRIRGFLKL